MTVSSTPRNGTSFKVFFPVLDYVAQTKLNRPSREADSESCREVRTVLLVDDDPTLLNLTRHILTREGISVLTAQDGLDAVSLYEKHHQEVDLVLMDLTMPRLDGIDAGKRMRAINPHLRIVLATGYSEDDITTRIDASTLDGILLKPYSLDQLMGHIRPKIKQVALHPC
jgi:two-component system, cell cycle sensor histidine kinase and response regulator CckA